MQFLFLQNINQTTAAMYESTSRHYYIVQISRDQREKLLSPLPPKLCLVITRFFKGIKADCIISFGYYIICLWRFAFVSKIIESWIWNRAHLWKTKFFRWLKKVIAVQKVQNFLIDFHSNRTTHVCPTSISGIASLWVHVSKKNGFIKR